MAFTPPIRRVNTARGHKYVDANSNRVPGVTTIIGDGIPKPALIDWAGNATADAAVDKWDDYAAMPPSARLKALKKARYNDRDLAANKGTKVHGLAQQLVLGERVEIPDELAGYVESYVRFLDENAVEPTLVETTVVSHRYGYAGTFDLLDRTRLIDVKTGRSGIFGETALQLAAYRYADAVVDEHGAEQPMPPIDWTGAVHVRADGYDLVPVQAGRDEFRTFLYAQQIAGFVNNSRDLIGAPLNSPASSSYRLVREDA